MERYTVKIKLTILGPFLTAAASTETYGIDKAFHRDSFNTPVIPGSHIKGKLRMALEELESHTLERLTIDIASLFGQPSKSGSYLPDPGRLHFSTFICDGKHVEDKRTRTAINPETLTAAENKLRDIEDLFPSGASYDWLGNVSFFSLDLAQAQTISNVLRLGFTWLTNLGAEKGVGSGRLKFVSVSKPMIDASGTESNLTQFLSSHSLHLQIRPKEFLMLGGIKKPRANFVQSERIIPGRVIKGAIATSTNWAHNILPVHTPLSADTGKRMPGFEKLAEYFNCIRISHAFPAFENGKRPVKVPLSTVQVNGKYYDMALVKDDRLLIEHQAPLYSVDWKKHWDYFGAADPKEVFVTRTSIHDKTRRSLEGELFTYSQLCATDNRDRKIDWISNVDFSAITDSKVREQVIGQFVNAVTRFLKNMGKLNQPVTVAIFPENAACTVDCQDTIYDGQVIVTLQTDAVLLNPDDVQKLQPGQDLKALYADYWRDISSKKDQGPCLELVEFFAAQTFQGGYLYHRYLGDGKIKKNQASYYPYYLTEAGSVFVLRPTNPKAAKALLQIWLKRGIELPDWAVKKFSHNNRPIWQCCPFVPENGYGEIAINLNWHWEKRADLNPQVTDSDGGER